MITRRKFISLSATSAAALSLCGFQSQLDSPKKILARGSKKKGICMGENSPGWAAMQSNLHCKWCYTWGGSVPSELPEGMEFIPMIRSKNMNAQTIAQVAGQAKEHGIRELLGLNEPDEKTQDGMTVQEALDAWPLLMETGMRLGSPACVHPDNEWMIEFMAGVKKRKLRVDFVCMHSYDGPWAEGLVMRLAKIHQMFNRPIWITEFAVADWAAKSVEQNRHKPETVQRYMEKVLPMLDRLHFLERYAWYPANSSNAALGSSALFDDEGALTPLGKCYRDA